MFTVALFFLSFAVCFYLAIKDNKAYLFVLYELIYFFSPETKWWGKMIPDISYSFYTVVLLILFAMLKKDKFTFNNPFKVKPFLYLYLLVILYAIASLFTVYPIPHSIALDALMTLAVLVTVVYIICDNYRSLHIIINGYILGASYLSFYIFQFGRNSGGRVEYIGMPDAPDANGIAAAIAPALPIALGYFWVSNNWKIKVLYAIGGVFLANALILINSRGAFLGAACGILFLIIKLYRGHEKAPETTSGKNKFYIVLLVIAGLGGAFTIADDAFIERMLTIKEEAKGPDANKESGATRMVYWIAAWDMAKDHPLGAGRGGFEYYAPQYIPQDINTGGSKNRAVHSSWFEALSEIGYLGMFALCMMIWLTFKMAKKVSDFLIEHRKVKDYFLMLSVMSALISMTVSMTFVNRMRAEVLYWIIIFISVAYKLYIIRPRYS